MKYAAEMGCCHDKHTKFHKDWFRRSKVDGMDTKTHRQDGDCMG
jgi:hypothetical protein